ncbi:Hypothetical predicted protein [Olea europaea subsp. europaea]|uniref:Uncharacterized protein n=1 Tax=Olea europaea subsp. europaea TaxID=158383 RepID=A0A8S0PM75_OLEEU|nr:Hypothetical predicted protein [Olea europaea subsp. europaea]
MATTQLHTNKNECMANSDDTKTGFLQSFDDAGDPPNPFGELGLHLFPSELLEITYEVLIGACQSSGADRPLTYISSSERTVERSQTRSKSARRSNISLLGKLAMGIN